MLSKELRTYHVGDLLHELQTLSRSQILMSFFFTILNFLVFAGYEKIGVRFVHKSIHFGKIALAAFVAYAFSNNMASAALFGSAIRFRYYSVWGFSSLEIAQLVEFSLMTFWLGLLAISSLVLLVGPSSILHALPLSLAGGYGIGLFFLGAIIGYLTLVARRENPISVKNWQWPLPSFPFDPWTDSAICD